MKKIYIAKNLADAHLLRGLLEGENIEAEVRGEFLYGVRGEVPITPDTCPSVWVMDDADYDRAMELVSALREGEPPNSIEGETWRCSPPMKATYDKNAAKLIGSELEATRASFHALLDSLSEADWYRPSLNPGWTNGEILAHMLFGFIIVDVLLPLARLWGRLPESSSKPFAWLLNAATGPFHWINAHGARMQGRVFTHKRIGGLFDRIHASLLKKAASIKDDEWERGMHYPTKWDSNFSEFMTIEKLLHYPVIHFKYHLHQLSR